MKSEIEKTEAALRTLVGEMVRIDREKRSEPPKVGSLMGTSFDFDRPISSRYEISISRVQRDPIRGALKNAVRLLGEHLFETTQSTDAMEKVLERIAADYPVDYGRYADIMDKSWDGIGSDAGGWWWA
jgi:hypothetical protein